MQALHELQRRGIEIAAQDLAYFSLSDLCLGILPHGFRALVISLHIIAVRFPAFPMSGHVELVPPLHRLSSEQ
jgi:hypothetical protein